jgi:hypothetical protein
MYVTDAFIDFFEISVTQASLAGYPTTTINNGFSLEGRCDHENRPSQSLHAYHLFLR